jgi:AmmeMemoRadiSam system protein A
MSQPSEFSGTVVIPAAPKPEYSHEERILLLQLAHESILAFVEKREISVFTPSPHLAEPRGVFTTLYASHRLRGCVGYPAAILPLYRAVMETARAAAADDPRFPPVRREEAGALKISISVLSLLQPISVDEIEIGRHGLVVSAGGERGLLLPQVPVEHGWDRETFLEQTCLKAGLPPHAWKSGARLEGFTAEVFSDEAA